MTLTITYTGEPFRLDETKIGELDAYVPAWDDEFPGRACATLFDEALEDAIICPDGMTAECYGDDDDGGSGMTFAVYPIPEGCNFRGGSTGITKGWRDADNVWRRRDDERECDDPEAVAEALRFFVGELNAILGVTATCST